MIVPRKDIKITQYKSINKPVHYLSNMKLKHNINDIRNKYIHIPTKKLILSTKIETEYIIGFYNIDLLTKIKNTSNHPYFINTASTDDMLIYCNNHNNSLLILEDINTTWIHIDQKLTNVFKIDF